MNGASKAARSGTHVMMQVLTAKRCSWNWPSACSKACGAKLPSTEIEVALMTREEQGARR